QSQRSIQQLESLTIYPATELIMTKDKLREGFREIEKEALECEKKFRQAGKPEEAHRIRNLTEEHKEEAMEFQAYASLESYVHYFYPDTSSFAEFFPVDNSCVFLDEPLRIREHAQAVELEFRESMKNRLEKGYILPRQAGLLKGMDQITAL